MEERGFGRYALLAELGSGGMGTVHRARLLEPVGALAAGSVVALKVIHAHLAERPGFRDRLFREARIGRSVLHENVVRTLDVDEVVEDGVARPCILLELVEGQTLRQLVDEVGRVPEEICRHAGAAVASALSAMHAVGAVHRDLKPENVLLTRDHHVKVMDLGVARLVEDETVRLSQPGVFVGSVRYAAPEQFGTGAVDGRADLFALGALLYELACGRTPWDGEDFRSVMRAIVDSRPRRLADRVPSVSPFFDEVVHALLEKDAAARPAPAEEVARILAAGESSPWWIARAAEIRRGTRRPARHLSVPRDTSVVGRDADLAALHEAWTRARNGEGRVVLIEGEAGIGKSRLVDELVTRLSDAGEEFDFLHGGWPPAGAATGSGLFSRAFRDHLGADGIVETVGRLLVATPRLVPGFAALLTGDAPPRDASPLGADQVRTAFAELLRALAAERPVVFLAEDLQFAPEEGRGVFAALANALTDSRVLLIGTLRPDVPVAWTAAIDALPHATHRVLQRLGPRDLDRLLGEALQSESAAQKWGWEIARKSDGNPYFAFEILRGLQEGRFLVRDGSGTWFANRPTSEFTVPTTIADLVHVRISELAHDDREILELAACAGYEFDPLLVGAAAGAERTDVLRRLARIERDRRLVRSSGRRFVFDHHQVHEALLAGISEPLREAYHASLADAIESRDGLASKDPSAADGAVAVAVCDHSLRGARGDRAAVWLDAALTHLESRHHNEAAADLAGRALALPGLAVGRARIDLLLRRAARLDILGRRDDEGAALDEARRAADAEGDPGLRATVLGRVAALQFKLSRFADAEVSIDAAIASARVGGDLRAEAFAHWVRGAVAWTAGRLAEARAAYEQYREICGRLGDVRMAANADLSIGNVLHVEGRCAEAADAYGRAVAAMGREGLAVLEAKARSNLAGALFGLGRYADADAMFTRSLETLREAGDRAGVAVTLADHAPLRMDLGDGHGARVALEEALEIARDVGARDLEAAILVRLAAADQREGRPEQAEPRLRAALDLRKATGSRSGLVRCLVEIGRLHLARAEHSAARAHLGSGLALAEQIDLPWDRALAECLLALLPGADASRAVRSVERLLPRLEVREAMEARWLLGRATGDPVHVAEARRLLDEVVAGAPPDRRAAILDLVPLHRCIASI